MFDCKNYTYIEGKLKNYYNNKKLISIKREYVEKLNKRLESIKKEYENIDIYFSLTDNLQSVNYDKIVVNGGQLPCSDVDRQIENMTLKLDKEKKDINNKIIYTNIELYKLENENDFLDQPLKLLDAEDYKIIELRYDKHYSYEKISFELLISVSNIYKKIKLIKKNLLKWKNFYYEK